MSKPSNADQWDVGSPQSRGPPDPDYDPPPNVPPAPPTPHILPMPRTPSRRTTPGPAAITPVHTPIRASVTLSASTSPATPTRGEARTALSISPSTSCTPAPDLSRAQHAMAICNLPSASSSPIHRLGAGGSGPPTPIRAANTPAASSPMSPTHTPATSTPTRICNTPSASPVSPHRRLNLSTPLLPPSHAPTVNLLPWYHLHPIVPIPLSLPLPSFDRTVFPGLDEWQRAVQS